MPVEQWAWAVVLAAISSCAAAQDNEEEEMPDLEFIEYLGAMVRADDAWIDPLDLERAEELDSDMTAVRVGDDASELEIQP